MCKDNKQQNMQNAHDLVFIQYWKNNAVVTLYIKKPTDTFR